MLISIDLGLLVAAILITVFGLLVTTKHAMDAMDAMDGNWKEFATEGSATLICACIAYALL